MGASVLPVTVHNGKVYLLFGKEGTLILTLVGLILVEELIRGRALWRRRLEKAGRS